MGSSSDVTLGCDNYHLATLRNYFLDMVADNPAGDK